jgi:capsid protein
MISFPHMPAGMSINKMEAKKNWSNVALFGTWQYAKRMIAAGLSLEFMTVRSPLPIHFCSIFTLLSEIVPRTP